MTDPRAGVRRRWWHPGRIALVVLLLVAVGGGTGWALGGLDAPGAGRGVQGAGDGTADPGAGNATTEAPECLQHSETEAIEQYGSPGGLTGVVYLRGVHEERPGWRIEVWICRDSAGRLFYQGHNGTPENRDLREGENALLLPVNPDHDEGEGRYEAVDRRGDRETRYEVQVDECEVKIGDNDFLVTHVRPGGGCG
jgi:hypothetical protein